MIVDRLLRSLKTRAARSAASTAARGTAAVGSPQSRRGAATLRRFSVTNVWARVAINRRKREISKAQWAIVRTDDPKAPPDAKVAAEVKELFKFVNDERVSLSWLLNMLVEDILVLDAGCLVKEKNAGGKIVALWQMDGAEIAPDPKWNGKDQNAFRYTQIVNGNIVDHFRDDELIYMMANPRSNSAIGLSPLEVLFSTIQADLYGEDFEYRLMRETAPAGMLYLGSTAGVEDTNRFRAFWENDIAGTRDVAIIGGGEDPSSGGVGQPPSWTPFTRSARDEDRREYMKWLATKVAAAFEMDLLAFNLSESVHHSVGEALQAKTDEGLVGLASVIESFITREILWEIDALRRHAFTFLNLSKRDELATWRVRQMAMSIGATFPNEIRAKDGKGPVSWGSVPYPTEGAAQTDDPAEPVGCTKMREDN